MKKLILIVVAIVFIGNITGQTSQGNNPCTFSNSSKPNTETSSIRGTVVDVTTGEAIPFVIVEISNGSSKIVGVLTDEQGVYFVAKLHPGNYKMKVATIGYQPQEQNITLQPGSISTKQFFMEVKTQCVCALEVEVETVISTPPASIEFNEDFGDPKGGKIEGPFTGLNGHNFIEKPAIIFPNPVRDILNIKSTDPITVIEILGIHGQIELALDPRSTMDVSTLAAGTYYARIHFENIRQVQVEKILVVQ